MGRGSFCGRSVVEKPSKREEQFPGNKTHFAGALSRGKRVQDESRIRADMKSSLARYWPSMGSNHSLAGAVAGPWNSCRSLRDVRAADGCSIESRVLSHPLFNNRSHFGSRVGEHISRAAFPAANRAEGRLLAFPLDIVTLDWQVNGGRERPRRFGAATSRGGEPSTGSASACS